jgi:hypothetical protein
MTHVRIASTLGPVRSSMQAQGRRGFGLHGDRDQPADCLLEAPSENEIDGLPSPQEVRTSTKMEWAHHRGVRSDS